MWILSWVVWLASPGCKEWAEGLEREAAVIESDWAALRWAMGSTRVLLDRRVNPVGALREAASRPLMWWVWPIVMVIQIIVNSADALRAYNWHDRIAYGLISFGWMYWSTFSLADWLWQRNAPPDSDIEASWRFRRMTLERQLQQIRSVRRWYALLVPLSMCTGFAMTSEGNGAWGTVSTGVVIVTGAIAIWMLCLDTPSKLEARLRRVNERIAAGPPVNLKLNGKRLHSEHWGRPLTSKQGSNL